MNEREPSQEKTADMQSSGFRSLRRVLAFTLAVLIANGTVAQSTRGTDEAPEPGRISISGQTPSELKVKRARTGHLLVAPKINGQDAGWFIFDTGAGMSCADTRLVERLNLADAGEASAKGEGGTVDTRLRAIKSLTLGPVLIEDSAVVELDLRPIAMAMVEQIDGVIGYECFQAGIYEVDLLEGKITVHDPATYKLPAGQSWQPITFIGRRPHITAQIEENPPGIFLLDLGANNAATISAPTVEKLKLLDGRDTSASMSGGVGGIHAARKGALKTMTLCGQKVENVPAIFTQSEKGALSEGDLQGSIGVGLLKQFHVIIDYGNQRIALLPRT